MSRSIASLAVSLSCLSLATASPRIGAAGIDPEGAGWEVDARLGVESEPAYAGSDVYSAELDGELTATYRRENGTEYFIGLGEIGTRMPLSPRWSFSALLEYEPGRDNADDPILSGFRKVDDTVEAQIALIRRFGSWSVGAVLQPDLLRRGKGVVYFVGVGHERRALDRLGLRASWDVSWADAEHMDTEFGVDVGESLASGLDRYRPGSGLKSTTLALEASVPLTRTSELVLGLELERYLAAAVDSPLIDDAGSPVTYEVGVAIAFELL